MSGLGQILHPRFNCIFNTVDIPWTQCYSIFSLSEINFVLVRAERLLMVNNHDFQLYHDYDIQKKHLCNPIQDNDKIIKIYEKIMLSQYCELFSK